MGGCVSSAAPSDGSPRPNGGGSRDASVRAGGGYRGATETLPEPWESTIRRGHGYPSETEDNTVRAAMRYSLDERERASFAKAQAGEKDEQTKLMAYVERAAAAAAAAAAAGSGSAPLRGSAGWRDSDASLACCAHYAASGLAAHAPTSVHAATTAGTRAGGSRPNQDAFGIAPGVATGRLLLAAVFDGHGPQGHFISRHVRDRLPAWISACSTDPAATTAEAAPHPELPAWVLRATSSYHLVLDAPASTSRRGARLVRRAGFGLPPGAPGWVAAAARAFVELDADLCAGRSTLLNASRVSADNSGCTAVCALLGDGHALIAAAGDSTAFLAQQLAPGHEDADSEDAAEDVVTPAVAATAAPVARPRYAARPLTVAHKPQGDEAQRVRLAGGRVAAHPGEEHIPRVWPREADVPAGRAAYGLAVSRAFGDVHWKNAGVCAAPDMTLHVIGEADAFLLLCSDGVTDVMSGARAVAVAADALHAGGSEANAAEAVNAAAVAAWAARFPRHARDDITTVIVLLRPLAAAAAVVEDAVPRE